MRVFAGLDDRAEFRLAFYLQATLACLTSRSSLLAVALLIVNDHLLKSLSPSWITGKLSDFAGLYFAPFLLLLVELSATWLSQMATPKGLRRGSVIPRRAAEAIAASAFIITGVLFAAQKLSPTTHEPILGLLETATGQPLHIVLDPTDLVALIVIPFAYLKWKRQVADWARRQCAIGKTLPGQSRLSPGRVWQLLVLTAAGMAAIATSQSPWQPTVMDIVADPNSPNVLYTTVGSFARYPVWSEERSDRGQPELYRTIDGGNSWQELGTGGEHTLADPHRPGTFYALRRDGVWRFEGAADLFEVVWPPYVQSADILPSQALSATMEVSQWEPEVLYIGIRGAVMRSSDGGRTWDRLPLPTSPDAPVTLLASGPSQSGLLFAIQDQHLLRSENWGDTWLDLGQIGAPVTDLKVSPTNQELLVAGTGNRLIRSLSGGRSWQVVWSGEKEEAGPVSSILFDPASNRMVYAAVRRYGLLTSENSGESWNLDFRGDARAIAITRSRNPHVFIAAGFDGVYRQRDLIRWPWLEKWEHANAGLNVGYSGFGEWLVNLASWLVILAAMLALARIALRRVRLLVERPPASIIATVLLALLVLVTAAFFAQWAFQLWVSWMEPAVSPIALSPRLQELDCGSGAASHDGTAWPAGGNPKLPDNATLGNQKRITPSNADKVELLTTFGAFETYVGRVAFSPDGHLLASGLRGIARVWDVQTTGELMTINHSGDWPVDVAFSRDGRLLATASKGTIKLWDVSTRSEVLTIGNPAVELSDPTFSPNGRFLAARAWQGPLVLFWQLDTARGLLAVRGRDKTSYDFAISPDACLLALGSSDRVARLWDIANGPEPSIIGRFEQEVVKVEFSPDGKLLAAGSMGVVKLFELPGGREVQILRGDVNRVVDLAFSPDGQLLASAQGWVVELWDVSSGRRANVLGHHQNATSVAFSPDGQLLASGSMDKILRLWGVR